MSCELWMNKGKVEKKREWTNGWMDEWNGGKTGNSDQWRVISDEWWVMSYE